MTHLPENANQRSRSRAKRPHASFAPRSARQEPPLRSAVRHCAGLARPARVRAMALLLARRSCLGNLPSRMSLVLHARCLPASFKFANVVLLSAWQSGIARPAGIHAPSGAVPSWTETQRRPKGMAPPMTAAGLRKLVYNASKLTTGKSYFS
ncbi:hypothetical protein IWX91DRAFT_108156 [Phyllosticta citricarpa]